MAKEKKKLQSLLWLLVLIPILALGIVVKQVHALTYPLINDQIDLDKNLLNEGSNDLKTVTCVDIELDGSSLYLYTAEGDEHGVIIFQLQYLGNEELSDIFDPVILDHFNSIYNAIQQDGFASDTLLDKDFYWNETREKYQFANPFDANPVINGETVFITNIDDKSTLAEIKNRISAIDNEDGDISHLIVVETDNYSSSTGLGEFTIIFKVEDSAGNIARLTVRVLVKDVTKPVITGKKVYNQSYTSKLSIETIKNALTVTDNVDSNLALEVEYDQYTDSYTQLGTYSVGFKATDLSGNVETYQVTVNVIDNVPPTFSGSTTIMKGQSTILTIDDIRSELTIADAKDPNPVVEVITDTFTGNGDRVGTYEVKFKATDLSGNYATHTVTVTVRDDIPPVFFTDNYFITVDQSVTLSQQDFIDILIASGQLVVNSSTQVQFAESDYFGNENVAGIYSVRLSASSTDGTSSSYEITTEVVNLTDEDSVTVEPSPIWQKIIDWFNKPLKEEGKFKVWHLIVCIVGGLVLVGGLVSVLKPKKKI